MGQQSANNPQRNTNDPQHHPNEGGHGRQAGQTEDSARNNDRTDVARGKMDKTDKSRNRNKSSADHQ